MLIVIPITGVIQRLLPSPQVMCHKWLYEYCWNNLLFWETISCPGFWTSLPAGRCKNLLGEEIQRIIQLISKVEIYWDNNLRAKRSQVSTEDYTVAGTDYSLSGHLAQSNVWQDYLSYSTDSLRSRDFTCSELHQRYVPTLGCMSIIHYEQLFSPSEKEKRGVSLELVQGTCVSNAPNSHWKSTINTYLKAQTALSS